MIIRDDKGITAEVHLYDNETGIDLSKIILTQDILSVMQMVHIWCMMSITLMIMQPMHVMDAILILKIISMQNGILRRSEKNA